VSHPLNILFLCTGNSARSIMAEAVLNKLGAGRFRAFSAGSCPVGNVNPLTLEVLASAGYPTAGLRSKGWDELCAPDSPKFDLVVTVCASAASETCPVFPGAPVQAHWDLRDPAAVEGPDEVKRRAFEESLAIVAQRVQDFMGLPFESVDAKALRAAVENVGPLTTNPFKGKGGVGRILHAFLNSMAGLSDAWSESAFRQEAVLAAILIPIACIVPVTAVERALLIGAVLLVIIVELLNTSVETAIDRISFDNHPLSKRAKDVGSAAVFVSLVLWAVVWGLILGSRLA
jgi:arsenate reductase